MAPSLCFLFCFAAFLKGFLTKTNLKSKLTGFFLSRLMLPCDVAAFSRLELSRSDSNFPDLSSRFPFLFSFFFLCVCLFACLLANDLIEVTG